MPTFLLGQSGRTELTNYTFVLEAPWKACRICGDVCQTKHDRAAYQLHLVCNPLNHHLCELAESRGRAVREEWLRRHNLTQHTPTEIEVFAKSALEVTAIAAAKLASYGIIHVSDPVNLDPDEDNALLEAPRAPINDAISW